MAPLKPMSAPTVVSSVFCSMNPSAQRAHPDAELRLVITTGMSAPPIDCVTCAPKKAEVTPADAGGEAGVDPTKSG